MTLEVRSVSFGYGRNHVLHQVSMQAEPGDLVGLLGPNGSGKSTLTKLIARINTLRSGSIWWDGVELSRLSRREHARLVAFVPQSSQPAFDQTVREAVLLGRTPYFGMAPGQADYAAVEAAILRMGLETMADHRVSELSGGQAQRVLIARAIAQAPQILLMDEPTSALDLRYQIETLKIVREISRETGVVVLIAIHDLNQAARFCDRIVLLENGRVRARGTPDDVLTAEVVSSVYGLPVEVHRAGRYLDVQPMIDEDRYGNRPRLEVVSR